jgi:GMP synthase (glutamine-hydrolysing)
MTELQAFRIGRAVYGMQFHFEAGTQLVRSWTKDFAAEIEEYAPDWFGRMPREAARHGKAADAAGLALARAWIKLVRPASPSAAGPARRKRNEFVSESTA